VIEIKLSQYNHPELTEGQHANGLARIFVRRDRGQWFLADGFRSIDKVHKGINRDGFDEFVKRYCVPVEYETYKVHYPGGDLRANRNGAFVEAFEQAIEGKRPASE